MAWDSFCTHDQVELVKVSDHLDDGPVSMNCTFHYEQVCVECGESLGSRSAYKLSTRLK